MNKLLSSLGAKICAVILFITTCTCLTASALGIGWLAASGAYADEGDALRQDILNGAAGSMIYDVMYEYQLYVDSAEYDPDQAPVVCPNTAYDRENFNMAFRITDANGKLLFYNYEPEKSSVEMQTKSSVTHNEVKTETLYFESQEERSEAANNLMYEYMYDPYADQRYYMYDFDEDGQDEYALDYSFSQSTQIDIIVHGSLCQNLTAKDEAYKSIWLINKLIQARYALIAVAAVCFVLSIALFAFLISSAGHKRGNDGISLNWADKIPLDLYAALLFFIGFFTVLIAMDAFEPSIQAIAIVACFIVLQALVLAFVMSFATRAKAGHWWRNTVIFKLCRLIKRSVLWICRGTKNIFSSVPHVWKTALIFAGLAFIEFISIFLPTGADLLIWAFFTFTLTPLVILTASAYKKLLKGSEQIARGDLDKQIDISQMFGDYRRMGSNLNNIRNGMSKAIEERLKSERFKTELITNVSHDIKTPLTSIINYVDLLKKEQPENEKTRQYLDVLDRQSNRLKNLIENLMEASKASTGNVTVNASPCELRVLTEQICGEYRDRLTQLGIELVTEVPDHDVTIMADGQHLWRIFDNLMNNICKYAQPSTRAYITLEDRAGRAAVILRNISRQRLNISAEDLTERFVRGDSSRTTEGNGLGLFIAKSLTELQAGKFDIKLDGDLFKVTLTFSTIKYEWKKERNDASDS